MSVFSVIGRVATGAIKGALTSGNPLGAVTGGLGGLLPPPPRSPAQPATRPGMPLSPGFTNLVPGRCPTGFILSPSGQCTALTSSPTPGKQSCPPGTVYDPQGGFCASPKSPVGEKHLSDQYGEAVLGRYGAALVPGNRVTNVATCPRGTVLGKDGLCYNKRDLRKSERAWPPGRKPLLTGGDLNAISRAGQAARKLEHSRKTLRSLGLIKAPPKRRKAGAA